MRGWESQAAVPVAPLGGRAAKWCCTRKHGLGAEEGVADGLAALLLLMQGILFVAGRVFSSEPMMGM